jgi:amino acid transporter
MFGSKEKNEKGGAYDQTNPDNEAGYNSNDGSSELGLLMGNADNLHRRLGNRQIQLIAIGGSIGTALFVSIGSGLERAGPGSLFIAYLIYACFLGLVNNCIAGMQKLL